MLQVLLPHNTVTCARHSLGCIVLYTTLQHYVISRWRSYKKVKVTVYSFLPCKHAQPTLYPLARHTAHVDLTLDSCTRYPSLLGGQRQCRMRSLPKAPTHDQCWELNPRPLDPCPTNWAHEILQEDCSLIVPCTTVISRWRSYKTAA